VVASSTAPACLHDLVADPAGGAGFYGLSGTSQARLDRFDAAGRWLGGVAVATTDPSYHAMGMVAAPGAKPALAISLSSTTSIGAPGYVVLYDLETPPQTRIFTIATLHPNDFGAPRLIDQHTLAVGEWVRSEIHFIDLADMVASEVYHLDTSRWHGTPEIRSMLLVPSVGRILTASPGDTFGTVFLFKRGSPDVQATATPYEVSADPMVLAPWPPDPTKLVAALTDKASQGTHRAARVALFDPTGPRFLRGSLVVGTGLVRDMIADPGGRVWLALPWTGSLVRIAGAP
jgi:hypothetical protein